MNKLQKGILGVGLTAIGGVLAFGWYEKRKSRLAPWTTGGGTRVTQDSKNYYLTGKKGSKTITKSQLKKLFDELTKLNKEEVRGTDLPTWSWNKVNKIADMLS